MLLLSANLAVKPRAFYNADLTRRRSTFPPSSWTPSFPPSPPHSSTSHFYPTLPFFFLVSLPPPLYFCGLSLSFRGNQIRTRFLYFVFPRIVSPDRAPRSTFVVRRSSFIARRLVDTNRSSSSNQGPVDYTLSNLVDTRTPFLVVFLFVPFRPVVATWSPTSVLRACQLVQCGRDHAVGCTRNLIPAGDGALRRLRQQR